MLVVNAFIKKALIEMVV